MKRDKVIDDLRGATMLLMILTHITAWYRKNPLTDFIWDFSHFSVPIFLFCSFYLFFVKPTPFSIPSYFKYILKRFKRLLVPYYIYLLIFLLMETTLGGKKMTGESLIGALFPWGGPDASWLVTLFLYLTLIVPLIDRLFRKNLFLLIIVFLLSFGSTVYFLFNGYGNYKQIMWLPWTSVVYFTLFFVNYIAKSKRKIIFSAVSFFMAFLLLRTVLPMYDRSLILYNNKYPPNLYYLSYGFFWILIAYYIMSKNIFEKIKLESIIHFFSINSYSIYFIHNLVIYVLTKLNIGFANWITHFFVVVFSSALIQTGFNKLNLKLKLKI